MYSSFIIIMIHISIKRYQAESLKVSINGMYYIVLCNNLDFLAEDTD